MPHIALVPIADGTEEIEAVSLIDVFRRAGITVTVASVEKRAQIVASHGLRIMSDRAIGACVATNFDVIALPGGIPGAEHLRDSVALREMLRRQAEAGRLIAAICAAPAVVLAEHGLLEGHRATAHPSVQELLGQNLAPDRVVVSGHLLTSLGPGSAIELALAVVEKLMGREKALAVAGPLCLPPGVGPQTVGPA